LAQNLQLNSIVSVLSGLVMTVDFRNVVLAKGDKAERAEQPRRPRFSPGLLLLTVLVGVIWGLCSVALIWGY
jgi:hypothetical protein